MKNAFFVFILSLPGVACAQQTFDQMADEMAGNTVPQCRSEELPEACIILDARELEEFRVSHIENAVWVGYDDFDMMRVMSIPKDQPVVVYCSVGYRSGKIAEKMKNAGFTNVCNLWGGIFHWYNESLPLFREGEQTDSIHPYNSSWGKWLKDSK